MRNYFVLGESGVEEGVAIGQMHIQWTSVNENEIYLL